jgi:SAM-dependent methyltransferase
MSDLSACDDAARDRYWEAASDAWGRWADAMAAMADKLNQPLLEAAGVCEGDRVLDLAGGAGEPAFSSARRAGAGGLSVCTDIAPGMLAGAAARKRPEGAPSVVFSAADMCALPFVAGAFDAVTCRFGVMFVPDVRQALQEAARVLKPGGRAAFMLWGPLVDNALFAQISVGVDRVLGPPAPGDALEGLFRFAAPDSFAPLLRAAGFRGVGEQEIRLSRRAKLTEAFWRPPLEMSFSHRLDGLSADRRREVEQSVADRFAETADAEGCVNLPLHIRIVGGQI